MRFDLEIPPYNIDICFIKNNSKIVEPLAPIYYIDINSDNKIPSDFVTYDGSHKKEDYDIYNYEIKTGPYIEDVKNSKLIITNISKYSSIRNTKIPLFYKHIIPHIIKSENIKIEDYFGKEISKEDYLIEYSSYGTAIYMNKADNKILFIRYISNNISNKILLNLTPVFEEADWNDFNDDGSLKDNKYIYRDGAVDIPVDTDVYISYIDENKMLRPPLGNIEDEWFIGILNIITTKTINNVKYTYSLPEYISQNINADGKYKFVEFKKCTKIYGNYVKSQYNIYDKNSDDIFLYIKDITTGKVKYAFTFNKSKIGTIYQDNITYSELKSYTNDGIFESPISLEDKYEVYASHYTVENYYIYNLLDIKNSNKNRFCYFAIFIKPNITSGRSVYHAIIGDNNEDNDGEIYFNSYADYQTYITNNKLYHIGIFNIFFNEDDISLLDIRDKEKILRNKEDICAISTDMLYYDVLNRNIDIPTNDAVLVTLDIRRLQNDNIINTNNDKTIDNEGVAYLRVLEDNITNTLHASTKTIFEIVRNK